ncbi:hypothetical protein [uncultured Desulfosarcina sp.]|uniref:hypothetical protein n=1 Tax=uncultured Desulfosarcina sp. TaxID=218289 RepID=UPI0029C72125|nr:hypothetical protein [uncultured Desulfosarcina sp.]
MDFEKLLSSDEQAAIAVLQAGGFKAFTDAKMADVRELDTSLRLRTFRNRGRYQLVLACKDLEGRRLPDTTAEPDLDLYPGQDHRPTIASVDELREAYPDLCRQLLNQASQPEADPVPELPPAELKPVEEMFKEELLAEARTYPEITGEHKMNKPELAAAVQARRDRCALIHRTFEV